MFHLQKEWKQRSVILSTKCTCIRAHLDSRCSSLTTLVKTVCFGDMLFFSVGKNNPFPSWTIARILFYVLRSFPWSLCALLYLRFWSLNENTQCSWYDHGKISCSFCLITFHSMFTWTILPVKLAFWQVPLLCKLWQCQQQFTLQKFTI